MSLNVNVLFELLEESKYDITYMRTVIVMVRDSSTEFSEYEILMHSFEYVTALITRGCEFVIFNKDLDKNFLAKSNEEFEPLKKILIDDFEKNGLYSDVLTFGCFLRYPA